MPGDQIAFRERLSKLEGKNLRSYKSLITLDVRKGNQSLKSFFGDEYLPKFLIFLFPKELQQVNCYIFE